MRILFTILLLGITARAETVIDCRTGAATSAPETTEAKAERQAAGAGVAAAEQAANILPTTFTAIAILNDSNHWTKLVAVGDQVIPIEISHSPLDPDTAAQMETAGRARLEANRTNRIATARGARTRAAGANSIAALRAEVVRLAELVEELSK